MLPRYTVRLYIDGKLSEELPFITDIGACRFAKDWTYRLYSFATMSVVRYPNGKEIAYQFGHRKY